jgi:uncharacterized protein
LELIGSLDRCKEMKRPELICDHMLERLARWLRMAGYDTLLPGNLDDKGIFEMARTTGRVLITRDKDLSNRKGIRSLRIKSDSLDDQFKEFLAVFPCTEGAQTRCPVCNGGLEVVERERTSPDVPSKVLLYHEEFFRCQSCGKSFWRGTHWDRIESRLTAAGIHPFLPTRPQGKSNQG